MRRAGEGEAPGGDAAPGASGGEKAGRPEGQGWIPVRLSGVSTDGYGIAGIGRLHHGQINRGAFLAWFLIASLEAIGVSSLRLE